MAVQRDSAVAHTDAQSQLMIFERSFQKKLHSQVVKDIDELRSFYRSYKNPIEPIIAWSYGHFLKANNQPGGKQSYNEVVAWLVAYYKKFGIEGI